jgi:CPA2 family monovalent cation:H+ antiporter-2
MDSAHAGKTLAELALRTRFGCSIVGIDRQGFSIVNPQANLVLYPHDKLLLLGGRDSLVRAGRELLSLGPAHAAPTGFDELTMETVRVPQDSALVAQPLINLDLIRRTGAQIGAIRNYSRTILSPTGSDAFHPGDELLVLGTTAQIRAFCQLLSDSDPRSTENNGG